MSQEALHSTLAVQPPAAEPVNILLVDDQPGKLLSYEAALGELGETLLTARSAREAMEVLLKTDVALILIDVNMPEINGFELAQMIRQHPRFEKTAMMFVSAVFHDDLDRIRGYSTGAVDYVSVPVVPEILRAKVRVFVELFRKTRQLEALNRQLEHRITASTADLAASTARLQESEERLRLALVSARAGAWSLRFDTGEIRWSPELFSLFGLPRDSPVPTLVGPLEHVFDEDRPMVMALIESLPFAQGPLELEFRARSRHEGEALVWMQVTGEVTRDRWGGPLVARGILQDVTSRKLVDLALEHEARRKDDFLATLAHELRNPLAPMVASVRLLRTNNLEPEVKTRSHLILERQIHHFRRLVNDLLDVSRLSRGGITLYREPVDLSSLVQSTLEALGPQLARHQLISRLPRPGPRASVDPVRVAQVLSHLLDNAVKFTPAGQSIEVTVQQTPQRAEIVIADTGKGIAPADLDRVFQFFTQMDADGGQTGLGIGLGLARRLIELHDGQVWAHSDGPGLGTRLTVELPLLRDVVLAQPEESPDTSRKLKILVVDDNADVADTLAEFLRMSSHEVRTAYGGEEAFDLAAGYEPDVVFIDLGMPAPDGFETAQRMRGTPWGSHSRLFALTGWGEASDRERTAQAGFDGHLVKPVDLDELLRVLGL